LSLIPDHHRPRTAASGDRYGRAARGKPDSPPPCVCARTWRRERCRALLAIPRCLVEGGVGRVFSLRYNLDVRAQPSPDSLTLEKIMVVDIMARRRCRRWAHGVLCSFLQCSPFVSPALLVSPPRDGPFANKLRCHSPLSKDNRFGSDDRLRRECVPSAASTSASAPPPATPGGDRVAKGARAKVPFPTVAWGRPGGRR
jgi:hypothetical protein